MKVVYRGHEIEVTREKCLGGWSESIIPFDFSSISYSFKLKNINKYMAEKLTEAFKMGEKDE